MIAKARFISLAIAAGFVFSSCHNSSGPANTTQTYQEQVMSVEEIERSQPTSFLTADGTYKENFLGDKIKIECTITNTATVATYKDVVVRFTYYSKTKTVLGTHDETLYEFFAPTSSKTFQLKIPNYQDVKSVGWEVVDAVGE